MRNSIVVLLSAALAAGCPTGGGDWAKSTTPTSPSPAPSGSNPPAPPSKPARPASSSNTAISNRAPAAAHDSGRAKEDLCKQFGDEMKQFGPITIQDLANDRACITWSENSDGQSPACYLRAYDTAPDVDEFQAFLNKNEYGFVATLSSGHTNYRRPNGRLIFWCGKGTVVPAVEMAGRAFVDAHD